MYFLYSVMTAAGLIALAPYLWLRGLRRGKNLRNLPERLGLRFPPELTRPHAGTQGAIWLHAVSVGEVLAAVPLAGALKDRYPERRLVVSTTTDTGQVLARERLKFADAIFYFPLDLPGVMRRAMRAVRPALIGVVETEIWPNLLRAAREVGAPVVYVNGRISESSFRGFQRWSLPSFRRRVLADGSLYLMQSEEDARRAKALGAPAERVIVTGNLKYDLIPPAGNAVVEWLEAELKRSGRGPLLVAGSVVAGEEAAVLEAFGLVARKWPQAMLLFAPRRPERFDEAGKMIEDAGWPLIRRSKLRLGDSASASALGAINGRAGGVVLLDSLGELASMYRAADAVFIGGSLVAMGGHNPLESAVFGKAPVFGPSMENFRDIAREFLGAGAALQAKSGAELGAAWIAMLENDQRRADMGRKARELVERHRGATAATLSRLSGLLKAQQAVE
jgi:3-deoxy-D-manno-octulosonic-acid transferase